MLRKREEQRMGDSVESRLETFFERETDGNLRSIVKYEGESFDVVYLRDDVAEKYTESELETAVDDSRLESLTAPIYRETLSADHGELVCLVKCFENVIEMNFVLEDGRGAVVALDAEAMTGAHGLVAEAKAIAEEGRS